jgi:membrane-bound metal-dependent hydrolase YbcI (DUF457 family)
MYFFFHLFTGIILGLLTADFARDRRWIIPCALGAVLPDLIDKPVGHIIFAQSIGFGRIYSHTLLFFILILLAGLACWRWWKNPFFLALAVGVMSHQVLDLMWNEPANWFWPLYGPFHGHLAPDYFLVLINGELNNRLDIFLALLIGCGLLLYLKKDVAERAIRHHRTLIRTAMTMAILILLLLAAVSTWSGVTKHWLPYIGWEVREEYIFGSLLLTMAAFLLWRWQGALDEPGPGPGK